MVFRLMVDRRTAVCLFFFVGIILIFSIFKSPLSEDVDLLSRHDDLLGRQEFEEKLNKANLNLTTIVTSWFPLEKSKHSLVEYFKWIELFIGRIEGPIVIYTTPKEARRVVTMRRGLPVQIITDYDTPFSIPPLQGMKQVYKDQNRIDREWFIHGSEVYAVWNAKSWMLAEVSQKNPFKSKYFLWVDIGSFRGEHMFRNWPDPSRVESTFEAQPDAILLSSVSKYPAPSELERVREADEGYKHDRIEGGFFGGSAGAVQWWMEEFYKVHDADLRRGRFVGKDQTLMNKVAALHFKRTLVIDATNQCSCGGDSWFYFQPFFANHKEVPPHCSPLPPLHFNN